MEDTRLTCPFEPSHRINASRMQFHLTRCIKNQTMVGKSVCPYNPLHIYDINEILHHCRNCPNNATVQQQVYTLEDKKCFANTITLEEAKKQLAEVLPNDDSWERRHAIQGPGYDPHAEIEKKLVYRSLNVASKSKREQFRMQERRRFADLEQDKDNDEEQAVISPPQSLRRPRKECVLLQVENATKAQSVSINKSDESQTSNTSNPDSDLLQQLKQSLIISDKTECAATFQELETLEQAERNNQEQIQKNQEQLMDIKEYEALIREREKQIMMQAESIETKNKNIEKRKKELLELLTQQVIRSNNKTSTDENIDNKIDVNIDEEYSNDKSPTNKSDKKKKSPKSKKNTESPSKRTQFNPKCAATFGSSSSVSSESSISSPLPLTPQAPGANRIGNGTRSYGRGIVHAWHQNNLPKIGRSAQENQDKEN